MSIKPSSTDTVIYHAPKRRYGTLPRESVVPIGLDTEAYDDGQCMVICSSNGDTWTPDRLPSCLFDRAHRDRTYTVYNLRYDMGALLQGLPVSTLSSLRETGRAKLGEYRYRIIANKMLAIAKGKHYVTIYDCLQYYGGSLDYNARKYLGEHKQEMETKTFSREYAAAHWQEIVDYCIHDAVLVQQLMARFVATCEALGMPVRKFYSTAWVSYSWFAAKCGHPTVGHLWRDDRRVLDYAMQSYNGGKFEVTTKGSGHLYEYDIVSAYPTSIAKLVDLYHCNVVWSKTLDPDAVYGFGVCTVNIPTGTPSPVAYKMGLLNTYPVGVYRRVITALEYRYLTTHGCDITVHEAVNLYVDRLKYPYREEITRLVALKQEYKGKDPMRYHTVKIILNSLYGKFCQLTPQGGRLWRAGSSWNPIYASYITAETRVRVTDLQRQYPSIWAVHTDSVISDSPLPYPKSNELGALSYECDGPGIVVACGVYEIGKKTAIRGVPSGYSLRQCALTGGRRVDVSTRQPLSWRQALQRNYTPAEINRWMLALKHLRVDMDRKRVWYDDYRDWSEVLTRNVYSDPYIYSPLLYRH